MAFNYSYDLSGTTGQVRMMIGDNPDDTAAALTGNRQGWKSVLADEEIAAVVTRLGGDLYLAASELLLFIASSKSLLAKMLTIGEYKLDTRHLADELRDQAQALRTMAENTPAEAVIETYGQQFSTERLIVKDLLANVPGWQDTDLP